MVHSEKNAILLTNTLLPHCSNTGTAFMECGQICLNVDAASDDEAEEDAASSASSSEESSSSDDDDDDQNKNAKAGVIDAAGAAKVQQTIYYQHVHLLIVPLFSSHHVCQ